MTLLEKIKLYLGLIVTAVVGIMAAMLVRSNRKRGEAESRAASAEAKVNIVKNEVELENATKESDNLSDVYRRFWESNKPKQ